MKRIYVLLVPLVVTGMISCGSGAGGSNADMDSLKSGVADTLVNTVTGGSSTDSMKDNAMRTEVSSDWLLVPGVSAGQTKIGEDADLVYKRLGHPDGGDAAMQKAVAIWYANHDSTAHSVAVYTSRNTDSPAIARILQIRVTSPSFLTKDEIHTTSSLADIQSKFSVTQTETYEDEGANYKVYDSKEGIAFEVNSKDKCVAIVIHKAGVSGEGTYLKFRTTNQFIDKGN